MGNFNCVTVVTSKMYLANPRAPNSQVLPQSILIKFSTKVAQIPRHQTVRMSQCLKLSTLKNKLRFDE